MDIVVNKAKLLETLQTNRLEHVELFQEAIEKYRQKALEWFEESIEKIKRGGEIERMLRLPVPEEHTEDFDRAISMLAWHGGTTITLSEQQFENFVENRWDWHRTFLSNTASYLQA